MTVSYMDTVAAVEAAEERGGLTYGEITRAMRVHVRSLAAEGLVAAWTAEDVHTELNNPEGVIWFTESGANYVAMLREAGVLGEPLPEKPRKRTAKSRKRTKKAPAQVDSPVLPKGSKARRVPGNQHGDQLHVVEEIPQTVTPPEHVNGFSRSVLEEMIAEAVSAALSS